MKFMTQKPKEKSPIINKKEILSKKQNQKNLLNEYKLMFITALSLFIFIGIFIIKDFKEIFIRNLGDFLISQLMWALGFSFFLAITVSAIVRLCIFFFRREQWKNWWFLSTIYLVSFAMVFGFFAIDYSIGNNKISLNLLDSETNIVGTIKCGGPLGPAIMEYKIICKTNLNKKEQFIPEKERIIPNLTLNGNWENATVSYFALENTTYLSLRVIETYHNKTYTEFSTGSPYSFITLNEFQKNRERFIQVFLALIAIAFVTIPVAMINFRDLWRSRLKT
mgnify:CR=1 FL=1